MQHLSNPGRGLGMLLLRAREAIMAEYRPIFRANDLTEQQWRILRFLEMSSPLDATSLSEKSMILAPSLTRILRDLEARGLLARIEKASGPTRLLVSITEEGRQLVGLVAPRIAERLERVQSRLSSDERGQLASLLDKISNGLG